MYDDMEDLLPSNKNKQRARQASLLSEIKDIEDVSPLNGTFLPSSLLVDNKKVGKHKYDDDLPRKEDDYDDSDPDEWFQTISLICSKPSKKKIHKAADDIFESAGLKKKKKKKKKGSGDLVDFKSEFETERALYKNLLMEQSKFVESLQREYDGIIGKKSSNRGLTKQMTDLIENINQARSLSMQLVEKNVNVKKLIAELNMKQKKEFGALESDNMNDFAASYIKNMISHRAEALGTGYEGMVSDYSEEELLDALDSTVLDDRPDDVNKYIEYDNRGVKVYVVIDENDPNGVENYRFIARDENGYELDDYPMPIHTDISINKSTNVATDKYGQKYKIIWE